MELLRSLATFAAPLTRVPGRRTIAKLLDQLACLAGPEDGEHAAKTGQASGSERADSEESEDESSAAEQAAALPTELAQALQEALAVPLRRRALVQAAFTWCRHTVCFQFRPPQRQPFSLR